MPPFVGLKKERLTYLHLFLINLHSPIDLTLLDMYICTGGTWKLNTERNVVGICRGSVLLKGQGGQHSVQQPNLASMILNETTSLASWSSNRRVLHQKGASLLCLDSFRLLNWIPPHHTLYDLWMWVHKQPSAMLHVTIKIPVSVEECRSAFVQTQHFLDATWSFRFDTMKRLASEVKLNLI